MKIGIELEMVLIARNKKILQQFKQQCKIFGHWTVDGSVYLNEEEQKALKLLKENRYLSDFKVPNNYFYASDLELVSHTYNNLNELLIDIKNMFFNSGLSVEINPKKLTTDKDVYIIFCYRSGMHIHYSTDSSFQGVKGTSELQIINNLKDRISKYNVLERMYSEICGNISNRNLIKDFTRNCIYHSECQLYDRYYKINISDSHNHGTIEFRFPHLHLATNNNLIDTIGEYVNLISKSVRHLHEIDFKTIKQKEFEETKKKENEKIIALAVEMERAKAKLIKLTNQKESLEDKKFLKRLEQTKTKYKNGINKFEYTITKPLVELNTNAQVQ